MLREFDYENMPVVDIVNEIIIDAVNKKSSDIHFDPYDNILKVRIRIDGQLVDYAHIPEHVKKNLITRIKIIAGMNITDTRMPQDGAIKTKILGLLLDMRVSSLPLQQGEKIVIRILDYSMSLAGLESLGLEENNLNKVQKLLQSPNGIILVTGATGSGKSTTVYAMLQKLNIESRNIITVEDPIEMNIEGINQVQVMAEIGLTFTHVLRSILRQDPDIVMIGEIRDDETARIAVRASITGHLVLSTLHTNNSLNTIERLLDMEVERYLLGSALNGVISQRLARRLCTKCKKIKPTTEYEKNIFKQMLNMDVNEIYSNVGCPDCLQGYSGRIAIHEVLVINQEIRDAIVNNVRKEELRKLVYSSGVSTLLEDGLKKVASGITSFEEVLRLVDLDNDFGAADEKIKKSILGEISNVNNIPLQKPVIPQTKKSEETEVFEVLDI